MDGHGSWAYLICPNIKGVCITWAWFIRKLVAGEPVGKVFEYFTLVVQYFKDTFPKLERVLLPGIDPRGVFSATANQPFVAYLEHLNSRRKPDGTRTWWDILDFLEENGWVIRVEE